MERGQASQGLQQQRSSGGRRDGRNATMLRPDHRLLPSLDLVITRRTGSSGDGPLKNICGALARRSGELPLFLQTHCS
jgi:hypothetical protein